MRLAYSDERAEAAVLDVLSEVERRDTNVRGVQTLGGGEARGLGVQKNHIAEHHLSPINILLGLVVGKGTYRWEPLPSAGAGPAYFVIAVPASVLTALSGRRDDAELVPWVGICV